jgi:hypothetical protein
MNADSQHTHATCMNQTILTLHEQMRIRNAPKIETIYFLVAKLRIFMSFIIPEAHNNIL